MKTDSCCKEDLLLYHYQELDEEQRRRVDAHLAACSACRTELDRLRADLERFADPVAVSAADRARLADRILARSRKRRLAGPVPLLALGSLGALCLLLVLWLPGRAPAPQPTPSLTAELELLEQLELLDELDLIQNLELVQELEDLG